MDEHSLNKKVKVVLHQVGQNLNTAYRTCEFFGVEEIHLHKCKGMLKGNLFKAKNNVEIKYINEMPLGDNVAYFETNGKIDINDFDFQNIDTICIGGETNDFINKEFKNIPKIKIQGYGKVSGLTVTSALSIALFKINNND